MDCCAAFSMFPLLFHDYMTLTLVVCEDVNPLLLGRNIRRDSERERQCLAIEDQKYALHGNYTLIAPIYVCTCQRQTLYAFRLFNPMVAILKDICSLIYDLTFHSMSCVN